MNYFVIRVAPRSEKRFIGLSKPIMEAQDARLIFLEKEMTHRKNGKMKKTKVPLFPGYVFLETQQVAVKLYWELKRTGGFLHFIKREKDIIELTPRDRELLLHFLQFGEVIGPSVVEFNKEDRIKVIEGPMEGLMGQITRVDRRKHRARVRVDFDKKTFFLDLPYKVLDKVPKMVESASTLGLGEIS